MQIELPATLSATYYHDSWIGGTRKPDEGQVVVRFGDEPIATLKPVRRFETSYDTYHDEREEITIANETLAVALTKLFALIGGDNGDE